jgi:hypothetical protein
MHPVLFADITIMLKHLPIDGLSKDFALFFVGILG